MASGQDGNAWKHVKRGHHKHRGPKSQQHQTKQKVATYSPEIQVEVKSLFEKKFMFEKPDQTWTLPKAEDLFTTAGHQVNHCY